jgi:uncharacterized membrane protein YhhN
MTGLDGAAMMALVAAGVVAVVDWWAVWADRRAVEYVAKPLTLVLLIVVALLLDPLDDTQRAWFVAALAASLLGDIFLMLPRDAFIPGLVSFLVGHLAYVGGFLAAGVETGGLLAGVVVVAVALATVGRRLLGALRSGPDRALLVPVTAYLAVISAMVVVAWGSTVALAAIGALLFFVSDALIGWRRFVHDFTHARVAVIVTYHLGQALLVLALVAAPIAS